MERLTIRGDHGIFMADGYDFEIEPDCYDLVQEILARLAAYEDTGMDPEEIERIVDAYGRGMTLRQETGERLRLIRSISTDRLRELVQADKDGRVWVLPCVPALRAYLCNEVFVIEDGEIYRDHVTEAYIGQNSDGDLECLLSTLDGETFSQREIGKTVFLTEEEAEKVLATDINVGSKEEG